MKRTICRLIALDTAWHDCVVDWIRDRGAGLAVQTDRDNGQGREERGDADPQVPAPAGTLRRMPEQRGADGVGIQRLMRFADEQLEDCGDLGGATDVAKHQRRPAVFAGAHDERRGAEQTVDPGSGRLDAAEVVDGKLVFPAVRDAHQSQVGQTVLRARRKQGTASPQQPLPGQRKFHGRSLTAC